MFFCGSLMPAGEESYKLTVEYGTKFDVVVGYFAAGISFRKVATAMLVSSTSGQVSRLAGVSEELVQRYTQTVIGVNLYKIRRIIVDAKVWAFSIAFDSATNRGY